MLWIFSLSNGPPQTLLIVPNARGPVTPAEGGATRSNAPSVFALTLSPITVRSGSDSPATVLPAGTDIVAIRLENDTENRKLTARRAAIRTVGGRTVWQGPVTVETSPSPGGTSRIEVPAVNVPADDYLVTLYGTDSTGADQEWAQYFLRVRRR